MKIAFLLGAGFSRSMNLPLAAEINSRFSSPLTGTFLQQSSGEWQWTYGKDSAMLNNGKLSSRVKPFEFLFEAFVEEYIKKYGPCLNYEHFYQWLVESIYFHGRLQEFQLMAETKIESFIKDKEYQERLKEELKVAPDSEIFSCLDHLIADMLHFAIPNAETNKYNNFIKIVTSYSPLTIFSLNHDLVLEFLFKESGIRFSNGFSSDNSNLIGEKKRILSIFQACFTEDIHLIKLHGSIDTFRFDHRVQVDSKPPLPPSSWEVTGDYEYFKGGYHDKHYVQRIDSKTGEVIQPFNPDISPRFITGIGKEDIIKKDKMYKVLFEEFQTSVRAAEILCIVGYSFADSHINNEICSAITNGIIKRIINVNPQKNIPLPCLSSRVQLVYLNSVEDLTLAHFQ